MSIIDSLQEEFAAGTKRIGEKLIELVDSVEAEAKFKKPEVREFSMNGCKVAATPENFRELERRFKLRNVSDDFVDEFAENVIKGINKMFKYYSKPLLTESECHVIRNVIYEYFNFKRYDFNMDTKQRCKNSNNTCFSDSFRLPVKLYF